MPTTAAGIVYPDGSSPFPSADWWSDLANSIETLLGSAWTDYTPAWTATGTAPSLGNATRSGRYRTVGKTIDAQVDYIMGSTTTYGTGTWQFALPVAAASSSTVRPVGNGFAYDASGSSRAVFAAQVVGSVCVLLTSPLFGPTAPFTWASGDELHFTVRYEAS